MTAKGRRRAEGKEKSELKLKITAPLALAQFLRFYDSGTYMNPLWPTHTNVIPWRLFWLLYQQIPAVTTLERIPATLATAGGIGVAFGGSDGNGDILRSALSAADLLADD